MANSKYTRDKLKELQALNLESKVLLTKARIKEWMAHYDGKAYVAFSGGKDSTVLLHIARSIFPDIPAVFTDTGLEYPEIREFVKTIDNVEWLYPIKWDKWSQTWQRTSFKEVISTYGYPVISKEQAGYIYDYRHSASEKVRHERLNGNAWGRGKIAEGYKYLIDAPFEISPKCCDVLKKAPAHHYSKITGRMPIIGTLAVESQLRETSWRQHGCNIYDGRHPVSRPLSFWTEQDILEYLYKTDIPFASVYGDVVYREDIDWYYTTGLKRTGCMWCLFGIQFESQPNRLQKMKKTHPKLWQYATKPVAEGGCGLQAVCDFLDIPTGMDKDVEDTT